MSQTTSRFPALPSASQEPLPASPPFRGGSEGRAESLPGTVMGCAVTRNAPRWSLRALRCQLIQHLGEQNGREQGADAALRAYLPSQDDGYQGTDQQHGSTPSGEGAWARCIRNDRSGHGSTLHARGGGVRSGPRGWPTLGARRSQIAANSAVFALLRRTRDPMRFRASLRGYVARTTAKSAALSRVRCSPLASIAGARGRTALVGRPIGGAWGIPDENVAPPAAGHCAADQEQPEGHAGHRWILGVGAGWGNRGFLQKGTL